MNFKKCVCYVLFFVSVVLTSCTSVSKKSCEDNFSNLSSEKLKGVNVSHFCNLIPEKEIEPPIIADRFYYEDTGRLLPSISKSIESKIFEKNYNQPSKNVVVDFSREKVTPNLLTTLSLSGDSPHTRMGLWLAKIEETKGHVCQTSTKQSTGLELWLINEAIGLVVRAVEDNKKQKIWDTAKKVDAIIYYKKGPKSDRSEDFITEIVFQKRELNFTCKD